MKRFILVDCNNFFVSCERVFDPKLIGKPVVVLSNNDGCVISRSNEAKLLGIPMGAAAFEYEHIFKKNNVKVFSSNFTLYADMSSRVMDTLASLATDIEIYSIDEAFLFIPNNCNEVYYKLIKDKVKQRTGIPISLGIGHTKTLAKIANKIAKKNLQYNGIFDLTNYDQINDLFLKMNVSDVWGIGYRYNKLLKSKGINTIYDLKYAPQDWVKKQLTILGLKTVYELHGISCFDLNTNPDSKKSITFSRSFESTIAEKQKLKEVISYYVSKASQKLREQNLLTTHITIFVATSRYHEHQRYFNSASECLSIPSAYTPDLLKVADNCLDVIFKTGYQYKKAGVLFSNLVSSDQLQLAVNATIPNVSKQSKLMKLCDRISNRWGKKFICFGSEGISKVGKSKRAHKSQNFTTNWHEILTINID